jgi:hypothetical protein
MVHLCHSGLAQKYFTLWPEIRRAVLSCALWRSRDRAPSGCGLLCCSLLTYRDGTHRRLRFASVPGSLQQTVNLFRRESLKAKFAPPKVVLASFSNLRLRFARVGFLFFLLP